MPTASRRLAAWMEAGEGDGGLEEVRAALDDDLDTPAAVAALDAAAADGRGVSAGAALLGVALDRPQVPFPDHGLQ
jgi:L-cysteine:1D-myo-inositol 2-amino-2-deoxy-alpha-D-glucopyranoside ligase